MTAALTARWLERWPAIQAGAFGLLHQHAVHNVLVDTQDGPISSRNDWIASLVAEWTGLTGDTMVDRAACAAEIGSLGTAIFVATGIEARNTGESAFGPATSRTVLVSSATLALVAGDRIYRAWRFVDRGAMAQGLGASLVDAAASLAATAPARGGVPWEYGEVGAGLGQAAPTDATEPTVGLPRALQSWAHRVRTPWNTRTLVQLAPVYSPDAELADGFQRARPIHRWTDHPWSAIVTALPDAVLFLERGCASEDADGKARAAVLWRWVGRHTGIGLGVAASGYRLHVRGLTYFELVDGTIRLERVFTDRLGVLADIQRRRNSDTPSRAL